MPPEDAREGPRSRWIAIPHAAAWFLPAAVSASTGEALLLGWQAALFGGLYPPGWAAHCAFWTGLLLYRRGLWRPAALCGGAALLAGLSHAPWLGGPARLSSGFWLWLFSFALLLAGSLRLGRLEESPTPLWDPRASLEIGLVSAAFLVLAAVPRVLPWTWYRTHVEAPALLLLLDGREPSLSLIAAERLSRLGLESEAAVPRLIAVLEGPLPEARRRAAQALGGFGPMAAAAVPALAASLDASDPPLSGLAAEALGRVGPAARPAVPALTAMVERSMGGDTQALESVRRISQVKVPDFPSAALPAVVDAISSENPVVRHFAEVELVRRTLAPSAGAKLLTRALASRSSAVRRQAVHALSLLGPEARPAVPALARSLAREALASDRGEVAKALGKVGPGAGPAAEALAARLDGDSDRLVRLYAAMALGNIGPEARSAVPALLRARRAGEPSVRGWANDALMKVAPDTAAAQGDLPAIAPPLRTSR